MTAPSLPLFNAQWYLSHNPDVAKAVERGEITAQQHFELFGKAEGRSSGPLFDADQYLSENPDVANAVRDGITTAYDHFVEHGLNEGRSSLSLFNADLYLALNPDVSKAVEDGDISAIEHLLTYGLNEGRQVLPFLNLDGYLESNADVAKAVQSGITDALSHLLQFGIAEGRLLSNGVDLKFFAKDPVFNKAIDDGRFDVAFGRVGEVAPFLPSFQAPPGWTPAADTPIPEGFVPPAEGQYLVVPEGVNVPRGTKLPDAFGPSRDGGNSGGGKGDHDYPEGPYFLTEENDKISGTNGDDMFYAGADPLGVSTFAYYPITLNTGDVLNGRGGNDMLVISAWSYSSSAKPKLDGIEAIINHNVGTPVLIDGEWDNGAVLDLSSATGVDAVATVFDMVPPGPFGTISGIYKGASLDTFFAAIEVHSGMNASLDIGFRDGELTGDDDTLTVGVLGDGGALGVGWNNNTNTGIEKVVIEVGDTNSTSIGFANSATVREITIKKAEVLYDDDYYAASLSVTEIPSGLADSDTLTKIDATTFSGALQIIGLHSTSLTEILTGSGNDVVVNNGQEAQTISTGEGNDDIFIGSVQSGHQISTGDGCDFITVRGPQLGNIRQKSDETGTVQESFLSKVITITDFDGAADKLFFNGSLNGLGYELDGDQQATVSEAANLFHALQVVEGFLCTGEVPEWTTFQFKGSTYIYQSNGDGKFGFDGNPSAADGLIELLNFTGALTEDNFATGMLIG